MSEQTLKRIFGAFAVLVVLWGISAVFSSRGGRGPSGGADVAAVFEGLDATTVEAVEIDGPTHTLVLERRAGVWMTGPYPADSSALDRFWRALSQAQVDRLVASNPASHARLGLSPDSARTLRLTRSDGGTSTLLVGKSGPTFPSTFVRLPDQDDVVVISQDLRTPLTRTPANWRDKTVVRIDTSAVARVVIERDGNSYTVERGDSTWVVDGEATPRTATTGLMQELTRFVANGFLEDGSASELDPKRVTALDANGDTLATVLFTGEEAPLHARIPGSDLIFEVSDFQVQRIAPELATLRPEEDPGG
jgi:hypothetical protein